MPFSSFARCAWSRPVRDRFGLRVASGYRSTCCTAQRYVGLWCGSALFVVDGVITVLIDGQEERWILQCAYPTEGSTKY